MTNKGTTQETLVDRAKRLTTVIEGLHDIDEGLELTIGQLTYIDEQDKNGNAPALRDCEETIRKELAYLNNELTTYLQTAIKKLSRGEPEACLALRAAEDVLKEQSDGAI